MPIYIVQSRRNSESDDWSRFHGVRADDYSTLIREANRLNKLTGWTKFRVVMA